MSKNHVDEAIGGAHADHRPIQDQFVQDEDHLDRELASGGCGGLSLGPITFIAPILTGADNHLPGGSKERKTYPIATGFIDYFPDAVAEVAHISYLGNQKHNPGQPLHWSRDKSADHADCIMRHFVDRGKLDHEGVRHSAQLAWRALALLQLEIEASRQS